jgi:ketosteroid isomerase-like protein
MTDEEAILARLARLGELVFARDSAVVDELWTDAGFTLYGSVAGEIARTRAELTDLFDDLYAQPFRFRWLWENPAVSVAGDVAWLVTECQLELTFPDRVESLPYRITAIFQRIAGQWRWRLYSGSEPSRPAAERSTISAAH